MEQKRVLLLKTCSLNQRQEVEELDCDGAAAGQPEVPADGLGSVHLG